MSVEESMRQVDRIWVAGAEEPVPSREEGEWMRRMEPRENCRTRFPVPFPGFVDDRRYIAPTRIKIGLYQSEVDDRGSFRCYFWVLEPACIVWTDVRSGPFTIVLFCQFYGHFPKRRDPMQVQFYTLGPLDDD